MGDEPGTVQGTFGNMDHLRPLLSTSAMMKPNMVYWLTDCTPHESVPLETRSYRQFFRLVSSKLSIWFECSSTKNPCGVVPPETTYVYKGNKFGKSLKLDYSQSPELQRMLSHYGVFNDPDQLPKDDMNEPKEKQRHIND